MTFTLREGIFYCQAGGRTIFLDALQNRYFCLSRESEAFFSRLCEGSLRPGDDVVGNDLARRNILEIGDVGITRPQTPQVPERSLLDVDHRPPLSVLASVFLEFVRCRVRLGFTPDRAIRELIMRPKPEISHRHVTTSPLTNISGAFQAIRSFTSSHDLCLAWSLALLRVSRRLGHDVTMVIGVSVRPFRAHCWVQSADYLINDRYDYVRNFSPIVAL
jgi:hypothetical protein